jgi:hypothetical protein
MCPDKTIACDVPDEHQPKAELSEHEELTRSLNAAQDEIEKLTRQRDDARALAVRSRLFETPACDCVFTDHPGGLCQVLTEEEMHAAGVETDHSVGHYPGETCERCGLGVGGRNRER